MTTSLERDKPESSRSGLAAAVRGNPISLAAVLLGLALLTWIVTIQRMRGDASNRIVGI